MQRNLKMNIFQSTYTFKQVLKFLYTGIIAFIGVALFLFLIPAKPVIYQIAKNGLKSDLNSPFLAYEFKKTKVYLSKGDLLKDSALHSRVNRVVIPAKFFLSPPFKDESLDARLWVILCNCTLDDTCRTPYQDFRDSLAKKRPEEANEDKIWVVDFDSMNIKPSVSFLAGIEVDTGKDQSEQEKEKRIAIGMLKICNHFKKSSVKRIAVPVFGSGAAQVNFKKALENILNGINQSAINNKKELEVEIVIYPGPEYFKQENKRNHRKFKNEIDDWDVRFGQVTDVISKKEFYNGNSQAWQPIAKHQFWWQMFLSIAIILTGAVIAIKLHFKKIKTLTISEVVVLNLILSTLVPYIGFEFGRAFIDNPGEFISNLHPLTTTKFLLISIILFILSFWLWHSEIKEEIIKKLPLTPAKKNSR